MGITCTQREKRPLSGQTWPPDLGMLSEQSTGWAFVPTRPFSRALVSSAQTALP